MDPTSCSICSRPDAAIILAALNMSDRAAHRAAGEKPPWASFQRRLREHRALPPHDAMVAVSARLAHVQADVANEIPGTITAGTAVQRLEHLIMRVERLLRRAESDEKMPGQSQALLIREGRALIESVARLSGELVRVHEHQHHHEVTGANGGPVQVVAAILPVPAQALKTKAESGDIRAQKALDLFYATDTTDPREQVIILERMLTEAEASIS